jgi:hypothetical protein
MFTDALRAAGIGAGKPPGGMDIGLDNQADYSASKELPEALDNQFEEMDPSINFVAFGEDLTGEMDGKGEEADDPRIAQLIERNQALESRFEKMMELLAKRQEPAEAPVSQRQEPVQTQEEIDFFKGYDPTNLLDEFTREPNGAIAQAPIIKQLSNIILKQEKTLRDLQARFDTRFAEIDYFEEEGVQDLTDKQLHRKVMGMAATNPKQLLSLAAKQMAAQEKEERQTAAKAAEGVKTSSRGGRSEQAAPRVTAQERAAMEAQERVMGGFNMQRRLNEIVARNQRR